jgi:hypothetical protein
MKYTDIPTTTLTASPSAMKEESQQQFADWFLEYLEENKLIVRSSLDRGIRSWLEQVEYNQYSELFDNFWDNLRTPALIEKIVARSIQLVALISFKKPPSKDLLRQVTKAKVAETLLDRFRN